MTSFQSIQRPDDESNISLANLGYVFDLITTAIVVLDSDLTITNLNSAAENILDISKNKAIGLLLQDQIFFTEDLALLCNKALDKKITYRSREIKIRTRNKVTPLSCIATPILDIGLKETPILLELQDIRRDKIISREEELANQRKLSRTIVQQLAHEVKNPLGGLRGAAQLLERKLPSKDLKKYKNIIIDEADRLVALVDKTLGASGKPNKEKLSLHEISEYVIGVIENEKDESIEIIRDYDPSIPLIFVDKNQIIQVVLNIVKNSLYAISTKGRVIFRTRAVNNFTLGGDRHKLVIKLEVEDDGPGIPEDIRPTIFYPLVTSKLTGTGLGLTIAQDLIIKNKGLIEFTSQPGATVFSIIFPSSQEDEA